MSEKMSMVKDTTLEQKLEQSGAMAVKSAEALVIDSPESYELGNKYLATIKERMKEITDYWAEPKKTAQQAHKNLVAKEKAMLEPMQKSDQIIRGKMKKYHDSQEAERRKAEAAIRQQQEEETRRLLDEAIKAEENGDAQAAATHMAMAELVSEMPVAAAMESPAPKGVRKTWKARVTNPNDVPAYYNGMEIRTINLTMLNIIARSSNGTAKIPGVELYEDTIIIAR